MLSNIAKEPVSGADGLVGLRLLFVLLYAMFQGINANLPSVGHFNSEGMCYALAAFLILGIIWMVHWIRHFSKSPDSDSSPSR